MALAGPVREAARAVNPHVPLTAIRSMEDVVDTALTSPRITGSVFAAFAAVAVPLSAIGIGAGLVLAAFWTRTLAGLLDGVPSLDPATLAAVALLLAGVALAASVLPARRAARIDPLGALKGR